MTESAAPRGVVSKIFAAYPEFRASMARELAAGRSESEILAYAFGAALALFLAALPVVLVAPPESVRSEGPGFLVATVVTYLFFIPLFLYVLAAAARLIAVAFGGGGGWRETRLAMFWAIIISAPVIVPAALVTLAFSLANLSVAATFVDGLAGLTAAWIWSCCLAETHGFRRSWPILAFQIALLAIFAALALALSDRAQIELFSRLVSSA